jgi:short-subunit dehydrogenase
VLGVNLHGVINGVVTFVPRMKERGQGGHVVNTASMAAFLAGPVPGIYNCSKFAVRGLSESLRYSLAPHGIGVSVLCPGLVKSHIYASDEVRPEALEAHAKETDPAFVEAARLDPPGGNGAG